MVTLKISGTPEVIRALDRLQMMPEVRKRDITAIFRKNMKQLQVAGAAAAPISKGRKTSGTLRKSFKFKTSKKYKNTWYVLPEKGRKAKFDAWYAHFHLGTRRGMKVNRFMDRAWRSVGNKVMSGIKDDLLKLIKKVWEGR
jgi:hypothetical protein